MLSVLKAFLGSDRHEIILSECASHEVQKTVSRLHHAAGKASKNVKQVTQAITV
jgi:hypothetical protein